MNTPSSGSCSAIIACSFGCKVLAASAIKPTPGREGAREGAREGGRGQGKGGREVGREAEGEGGGEGGRKAGREGGRRGGGREGSIEEGRGREGSRRREGGSGSGVMKEGGRMEGVGISVRCDGYIWSRCSHHGIGSTANVTTCAGVRGGRREKVRRNLRVMGRMRGWTTEGRYRSECTYIASILKTIHNPLLGFTDSNMTWGCGTNLIT